MAITKKEMRSQLNGTFRQRMKGLGFKGSGLSYRMKTDKFLFVIDIDVNFKKLESYIGFGIQPIVLKKKGDLGFINLGTIASGSCELTKVLTWCFKKPSWKMSDNVTENERSAEQMVELIQLKAMPVIQAYITNPSILDTITPSDIDNDYILEQKLGGVYPTGLHVRTAWMLALYQENVNPKRAAQFAKKGLAYVEREEVKITGKLKKMVEDGDLTGSIFGSDPEDEPFFGMEDLKRIAVMK
ncbi:DUF4304 domain-containing protein [Chitinophaga sp. CC14]|uniref:DUF4304 domain-containing protein n=1 Tax=Chitinophaga sp. CC14 TaxID=3029199 RepID=UPI003B7943A2